jgi:hypothetical protein
MTNRVRIFNSFNAEQFSSVGVVFVFRIVYRFRLSALDFELGIFFGLWALDFELGIFPKASSLNPILHPSSERPSGAEHPRKSRSAERSEDVVLCHYFSVKAFAWKK